jgi:hypothetical protein
MVEEPWHSVNDSFGGLKWRSRALRNRIWEERETQARRTGTLAGRRGAAATARY